MTHRCLWLLLISANAVLCLSPALAALPTTDYYRIALAGDPNGAIGDTDDPSSGTGVCTLRDALEIANNALIPADSPVNGCAISAVGSPASPRYRIELPAYTYTLVDERGEELEIFEAEVYLVGQQGPTDTVIQAASAPSSADCMLFTPPPGLICAKNRVLGLFDASVEIHNATLRHGLCTVNTTSCGQNIFTEGGGVLVRGGSTLTLDNARVTDNFAHDGGGGIQVSSNSSLTLLNASVVSGNTVQDFGIGGGGGIRARNSTSTVVIDNSTVSNNQVGESAEGGGILSAGVLIIRNNSQIRDNHAGGDGGGIAYAGAGSSLNLDDSTVAGNTSDRNGGGIHLGFSAGPAIINDSLIGGPDQGNEAPLQGIGGRGGGIYLGLFGSLNLKDTIISHNRANYGGGVANEGAEMEVLAGSLIANNQGTFSGGGIFNSGANAHLRMAASQVRGNSLSLVSGVGGGIANQAAGIVEILKGSVIGTANAPNQAGAGGGIHNFGDDSEVTVDASEVKGNSAVNGGGIYNAGGRVWIQASSEIGTLKAPNIVTGNGGGIFNTGSGAELTVTESTVRYNEARFDGGGLYNSEEASLLVENGSRVDHNQVDGGGFAGGGGGIYNHAMATIRDASLRFNHSASHGGAVFNGGTVGGEAGANMTITRTTITDNSARGDGGAVRNDPGLTSDSATLTITASFLLRNRSDDNGDGINNRASGGATATTTVNGNCVVDNGVGYFNDGAATQNAQGNWWGAGDGPADADGASGATGSGDGVTQGVDFSAFLDVPPVECGLIFRNGGFESD